MILVFAPGSAEWPLETPGRDPRRRQSSIVGAPSCLRDRKAVPDWRLPLMTGTWLLAGLS